MNFNTEFNVRKQKEKTFLSLYSVHPTAAIRGGNAKSRTKEGAFVAYPNAGVSKLGDERKNFSSS